MDDPALLPVVWTDATVEQSLAIKRYLEKKFTQREVDRFYHMLSVFEKIVAAFPDLYPVSKKLPNVRRAVLSKQLAVFYIISDDQVSVVAVLDNRMDYSKWP